MFMRKLILHTKFIGGFEVQKLNELIKSTVDKILADDRAEVKDWIDNGFYTTDGNGNKQYYDDPMPTSGMSQC